MISCGRIHVLMSKISEIVSWVSKSDANESFMEISQTVNRSAFDSEFRQHRVLSVSVAQIDDENPV